MADQTAIEWCDATFNPWIGCTRVSPACDHCYAADSTAARALDVAWGAGQPRRRTSAANWKQPLQWNREEFVQCIGCGWRGEKRRCHAVQNPEGFHPPVAEARVCPECMEPLLKEARRRVFCASLADVFDNEVDPRWREDLFALINATSNLDWLLLTKRIGNVPAMVSIIPSWLPANVWLGATICNQQEAYRDIPKLLQVPARVRFLSMEPLLSGVDLQLYNLATEDDGPLDDYPEEFLTGNGRGVHWVIAGGESGTAARPMHPDWVRSLRDQCAAAGVPFLFKQWGEWEPRYYNDAVTGERLVNMASTKRETVLGEPSNPSTYVNMVRVGKKRAGRTLDGATHTAFPEVR